MNPNISPLRALGCLLVVLTLAACDNPQEKALKALASENFKMTPSDFLRAASIGDEQILKYYIDAGMDINVRGPDQRSALLVTAERGHLGAMRLLIENGAEIDIRSRDGWTPLMVAAFNNQVEAVKLLIERGADPSKKDNSGWTALMQGVYKGHTQIVQVLADASDEDLGKALLVAALMGHADVLRSLLDAHADINARTEENETPLMLAAQKGRLEAVEVLLGAGADATLVNNVGDSAAAMAAERGHPQIAALIEEAAAIQTRRKAEEAARQAALPSPTPPTQPDSLPAQPLDAALPPEPEPSSADIATASPPPAIDPDATPAPALPETSPATESGTQPSIPSPPDAPATSTRDARPPKLSEEAWFKHYNLDLNDPAMLQRDEDNDGFTNAEEFIDNTDPRDPSSHPPLIVRAVMVDYATTELPYVLEGVEAGTARIRKVDSGEIIQVSDGDMLAGMRVERIRKRVISSKESAQSDVSEVTLRDPDSGQTTLLVRGQRARAADTFAAIQVPGSGGPVNVREGQEFSLPGEQGIRYKVFEIRPRQVIIRQVGGDATYTVKMSQ